MYLYIQNNQKVRLLCPLHFPDPGIQIFSQNSGFSKSTYLESTCYEEFPDTKIFPDKFCPGSGFAPKRWFSNIFLIYDIFLIAMDFYSLFRLVFYKIAVFKSSVFWKISRRLKYYSPMNDRSENCCARFRYVAF